jgi:membrane protease YdiL (CAAX protease family)
MFKVKGRYVVAGWLLAFIYIPGLGYIYSFIGHDAQWYWYDIAYYLYFQTLMMVLSFSLFKWNNIHWKKMALKPASNDFPIAFKLTAFIFVFSSLATYVVFLPLSYLNPEFVNYWFIDIPNIIYSDNGTYPWLPNFLSFISLVVLAPIIEEFAFRGLLLHRWTEKWNLITAILCSSLLFGLLHPDPVGAAAFGIAMCVIYLKTQTLIVPMVCHALYNFVCWLWAIVYEIENGPDHKYTISEFRGEWLLALFCLLIVYVWVYKYFRSGSTLGELKLPSLEE